MKCDGLPDPVCVRQLNTYLSLWLEDNRETIDAVLVRFANFFESKLIFDRNFLGSKLLIFDWNFFGSKLIFEFFLDQSWFSIEIFTDQSDFFYKRCAFALHNNFLPISTKEKPEALKRPLKYRGLPHLATSGTRGGIYVCTSLLASGGSQPSYKLGSINDAFKLS